MPVNADLLSTLLAPIAGDAPAGRDLRYDPKYEAFKEERREDLLIPGVDDPGRKVADWNKVVAQGTDLLAKHTKDLQLAAWMSEALLRRHGLDGLQTGLALLQGLLDQYWEGCFPLIEDGDLELRAGPLEWVGSKLVVAVQQVVVASRGITFLDVEGARGVPTEAEIAAAEFDLQEPMQERRAEAERFGKRMPEAVTEAVEATGKAFYKTLVAELEATQTSLTALEARSDALFGNDAPAYTPLRKALEGLQRYAQATLTRKLEADPDPIDVAVEMPEAETPVAADGPLPAEPVSGPDAAQRLAVVARWYRKQDPTSPAPYAMVRAFRWGELRTTPPTVDPRLLEAPPTALRARLKGLLLDHRWEELLEASEALMATSQGRGWLDLQRYVLTACRQLGATYDGVAAVVRSELSALLAAVPTLPRMMLMDDTPTANDETRAWLAEEGLGSEPSDMVAAEEGVGGEASSDGDTVLSDGTEAIAEALEDDHATAHQGGFARVARRGPSPRGPDPFAVACQQLAQGHAHRAIELLSAEMLRERSPRGRFLRQTQIAYVMVEAGLDAVAEPMLRKLVEQIDALNLEAWEAGPLVAQPLALLCRVLDRIGDDGTRGELYLRLCRLDPLQALALQAR